MNKQKIISNTAIFIFVIVFVLIFKTIFGEENTFIGNEIARNKEHKNWGEPFGWIVIDQKKFRKAIEDTKKLQDEGKLERGYAISWELYRVQNGTDPNYMLINDRNYLSIDDETIDIDTEWQIQELRNKLKK